MDNVEDTLRAEKLKQYSILAFFAWEHLPVPLQLISQGFSDLAWQRAMDAGNNHPAEVAAGLRKLLEAKDCFVRAALKK